MNIKKILNSLGIESENSGAAIGGDWLKTSGDTIISVSPVDGQEIGLSLIHISEPTRQAEISYAVFCLKKKKKKNKKNKN